MMTAGDVDDALLAALRRERLDTVDGAFAHEGGRDMTVPGLGHRERWALTLTDGAGRTRRLFMKRYEREPLTWRLRRVWTYGLGSGSPAAVEVENIRGVLAAGVATIPAAVAGQQDGRSYIIVEAVPGEALEQCAEAFLDRYGADSEPARRLTRGLAELVKAFHGAGYVHRDLYASHVFLAEAERRLDLRLIDLARAFRPRWRRFRWRVKDLAAVKYSMPDAWVAAHWGEFLDLYLGGARAGRTRLERAVERKAKFIAWHAARKRRRRAAAGGQGR
jgi:tRNA A-37 threonylcarbamoyl transferase component Bud32